MLISNTATRPAVFIVVVLSVISYLCSYYLVYISKMYFVTNKRLLIMMAEQKKIVKNLPDGVLICKQVDSRSDTLNNDFSQMVAPEPATFKLKFYNKTFQALFGLESDYETTFSEMESDPIIKSGVESDSHGTNNQLGRSEPNTRANSNN